MSLDLFGGIITGKRLGAEPSCPLVKHLVNLLTKAGNYAEN